jgi:predicted component of type VI protein secretion system
MKIAATPTFAVVEAEYRRRETDMREMVELSERMRIAIDLSTQEKIDLRAQVSVDRVGPELIAQARRNRLRLQGKLDALREKIEDEQPALFVARENYQAALQHEADRIAARFQPRQVAAVKKIMDSLKTLSKALAEEEAIHIEFADASPQPSALLPHLSAALAFARTDRPHSVASAWADRINALGILK